MVQLENKFGLKEIDEVTIKATSNMRIGERELEVGETIVAFDKIQITNWNEIVTQVTAHGGFDDRDHVVWESPKQINFSLAQGIFSNTQFAIMHNAKFFEVEESKPIYFSKQEKIHTTDSGTYVFDVAPCQPFFIYDNSGIKLSPSDYNFITNNTIANLNADSDYYVDYTYEYLQGGTIFKIGSQLATEFLCLQGKVRVKDDITGIVRDAIITIPKLKLMTGLSMRLGESAIPMIGQLNGIALPVGTRGKSYIMTLDILESQIDSDI